MVCPWNSTTAFLCKLVSAHLQPFNTSESLVVVLEGVIFWQADFQHLFQRVRSHLALELAHGSLPASFTTICLLCGFQQIS